MNRLMVRLDRDYNLVSPHFNSYNFFVVTIPSFYNETKV